MCWKCSACGFNGTWATRDTCFKCHRKTAPEWVSGYARAAKQINSWAKRGWEHSTISNRQQNSQGISKQIKDYIEQHYGGIGQQSVGTGTAPLPSVGRAPKAEQAAMETDE